MKAISLHQPWASLLVTRQPWREEERLTAGADIDSLAPTVKRFETRSWPFPPALIGQPIAFASTKRQPDHLAQVGDWSTHTSYYTEGLPQMRRLGSVVNGELAPDGHERGLIVDLPLGAIVGSGRITDCYPIKANGDRSGVGPRILNVVERLLLAPSGYYSGRCDDISDQLLYGDFTSGRYAWQIEDAAPTSERCPWCGGEPLGESRLEDRQGQRVRVWEICPVCDDIGCCDPIPARGHQRIWNWTQS